MDDLSPDGSPRQYRHNSDVSFETVETPQTEHGYPAHIQMAEPPRPRLSTLRGQSHRSVREAVRLERAREEQETLLGDGEQADDDGCYPPRKNDDPRVPNPHASLPVYTTIHKIRRIVLASIGTATTNARLH